MLTFSGPVLPDGEAREFYVVDGRITYDVVAGAETGAAGWIVPGLVDAHCHVGLDENGAVDEATQEQQAITDRDAGRAAAARLRLGRPTPPGSTTARTCRG